MLDDAVATMGQIKTIILHAHRNCSEGESLREEGYRWTTNQLAVLLSLQSLLTLNALLSA